METERKPKNYGEERLSKLFDECRQTVIEQIIGPFGLSMAMSNDKNGGGVDTIINVKKKIYASEKEKMRYVNRGEYNPAPYHSHSNYRKKNAEISQQKKDGTLKDAYTGNRLSPKDHADLDHPISAKSIHDDRRRILAEKSGPDLANDPSNLYPTNPTINRSKGQKDMDEFITEWTQTQGKRQAEIAELSGKNTLSDQERKRLEKLHNMEAFLPEEARSIAAKAKHEYEKQVNTYYRSSKFVKSAAKDAANTAVRTAIQQAIGNILVEFSSAVFDEMRAFIRDRNNSDLDIFDDMKQRLHRIMHRIMQKLKEWKEIAVDLRDGLLSGFLASLSTTLINIFATTAKRFVRAIREGIRSLVQAFKILIFRPEDMSEEEALKLVIKSLTGVFLTTVGIVAETALNTFLQGIPVIGQFASMITPVLIGILSGISIAVVSYYVDKVFHLFSLSQESFCQLCSAGNLQMEYSGLLLETGSNIIKMGNAYQQMIDVNNEIKDNNCMIDSSQEESLRIQDITSDILAGSIQRSVKTINVIEKIDTSPLRRELEETSEWIKTRKSRGHKRHE